MFEGVPEGTGIGHLCGNVELLIAVSFIIDQGYPEVGRGRGGETGAGVARPLHWRAHPVAVKQPDVVAHADFIAIVNDGPTGQGEQDGVGQFDFAAVIVQQRGQAAADAQVERHAGMGGVKPPHQLPVFRRNHLQG